MTSAALVWAWQQQVSPSSKLVLLALAENAAGDAHAVQLEQALGDIVRRTGLDRRTVQRHLRQLEQGHHVVSEERRDTGGKRLPNRFFLNVNELAPVPLGIWSDRA